MLRRFKPIGLVAILLWAAVVTADQSGLVDAGDKHSARYAATVAVDTNLAGRTAEIYTTIDHAAIRYVRSTNCWAYGFDLSCVAVYNSFGMMLSTNGCCSWENASRRAGTLISPRHLVFANHYPIPTGTQMRFVAPNNMVVTRTVVNTTNIIGSDLHIGVLDADVPPGLISFARVLPPNFNNYFPTSLTSIPTLCFNKAPAALVTDIDKLMPSPTNATGITYVIPTDPERKRLYSDKISGDSGQPSFVIIDGRLVILTVWTGGGPGTGNFIPGFFTQINAAMQTLGGGYRLTPVDLSRFTRY